MKTLLSDNIHSLRLWYIVASASPDEAWGNCDFHHAAGIAMSMLGNVSDFWLTDEETKFLSDFIYLYEGGPVDDGCRCSE